jgi:GTP cyclohydrolase I
MFRKTHFLNPKLDRMALRREVATHISFHVDNEIRIPILEGAVVINDFLNPDSRQLIEGQIYSNGTDLTKVYRTATTGYGENELSVPAADEQIPMLGELRRELDAFLHDVFGHQPNNHVFQLRVLSPRSTGHPRHVDYERGFDVVSSKDEHHALTSISLSLPISWDDGRSPVFVMETPDGNVIQDRPGSLALFGPTIFHSHPPTTDLAEPSLWLITQAFFKIKPTQLASIESRMDAPEIASWVQQFVRNESALATLRESESRIRAAYAELLSGYDTDPGMVLNEVERVHDYHGLVVERAISFTSFCCHHFLPFFGKIDVAYEPGEVLTGLGKIPRLVQAFARRFQLQELLVKEIAEQIVNSIGAKGVYVRARAIHLCMHGRGPCVPNVETFCSYATGTLNDAGKQQQVAALLG